MNLNDKRLEKERGKSPTDVLKYFTDTDENIKSAVVIVQYEDENIEAQVSVDTDLVAIGMLDTIKTDLANEVLGIYDD